MYRVRKVRGRSRRSQVVHFNNLQLYQKRQEAPLEEPVAGGSVDVLQGGSEKSERVAPAGGEVEPVEPGTVEGGTEDEVIEVEATEEFVDEVVDVQDESGYASCLADTASAGEFEQGGGCDQVVEMPDTEGGRLSEDVQNDHASVKENREDEHKVEEEQPAGQSPRPVRVRRPPDRYGEWILNSLQQITDRLKMLEDKLRKDKERIQKLRPKLLKNVRTLRGTLKLFFFFLAEKQTFKSFAKRLNGFTLFCVITRSSPES